MIYYPFTEINLHKLIPRHSHSNTQGCNRVLSISERQGFKTSDLACQKRPKRLVVRSALSRRVRRRGGRRIELRRILSRRAIRHRLLLLLLLVLLRIERIAIAAIVAEGHWHSGILHADVLIWK